VNVDLSTSNIKPQLPDIRAGVLQYTHTSTYTIIEFRTRQNLLNVGILFVNRIQYGYASTSATSQGTLDRIARTHVQTYEAIQVYSV
jgi:hypothetical protein